MTVMTVMTVMEAFLSCFSVRCCTACPNAAARGGSCHLGGGGVAARMSGVRPSCHNAAVATKKTVRGNVGSSNPRTVVDAILTCCRALHRQHVWIGRFDP
jgi:hypothetical protein